MWYFFPYYSSTVHLKNSRIYFHYLRNSKLSAKCQKVGIVSNFVTPLNCLLSDKSWVLIFYNKFWNVMFTHDLNYNCYTIFVSPSLSIHHSQKIDYFNPHGALNSDEKYYFLSIYSRYCLLNISIEWKSINGNK